jgi:hypothetical protein
MLRVTAILIFLIALVQPCPAQPFQADSAPPQHCESHFGQWCTLGGATAKQIEDTGNNDLFEITPALPNPSSEPIYVQAPTECRTGLADRMELASFNLDSPFQGGVRDELAVKLSNTCTLRVFIPSWRADAFQWPYDLGLDLIRACEKAGCEGRSLAEFRPRINMKYRRQLIRP